MLAVPHLVAVDTCLDPIRPDQKQRQRVKARGRNREGIESAGHAVCYTKERCRIFFAVGQLPLTWLSEVALVHEERIRQIG